MLKQRYTIYAVTFIDLLAVGIFVPLLAERLYLLGASYTTIGLISSSYSGLQVLTGPLIGSWSDTRGRKTVTLWTLLICSVSYALLGYARSVPVIFLLRLVLGTTKHTQTLLKALTADCVPKENRPEIYGSSGSIGSMGFIIGPLIGAHLSEVSDGFRWACLLTALLFLANLLLVNLTDFPVVNGRDSTGAVGNLTKIKWASNWDTFMLRFLFGFAISVYFTNQSSYLRVNYEVSPKSVGYLISFVSVVATGSGLSLGFLTSLFYADDSDCYKRLFHGFVTLTVTFVGLTLAPNVYCLVACLVPFGVANAVLRNVSLEAILARGKANERGSLAGGLSSVMAVSRLATPVLSGLVGDLYGQGNVLVLALLPSVCGTVLAGYMLFKGRETRTVKVNKKD